MGFFDFLKDLFNPVKGGTGGPKPAGNSPARALAPRKTYASPGGPRPLAPGLPQLPTPASLAALLRIAPEKLAWLAKEKGRHYATWKIPKAKGHRTIEAPKKQLRAAQRAIHREILSKVAPNAAAHGFCTGRSPRTNAEPHVFRKLVVKLDLRDFFWQVKRNRVAGQFRALGFPPDVAAILWRICCHRGRLPQGAPTSPALTNIVCRRLDARLSGLAKKYKARYTRYADDLTFSFDAPNLAVQEPLRAIRTILSEEGFSLAREKTRFLRRMSRQTVTGITVNSKLSPSREEVRSLRALLHEARTKGPKVANRNQEEAFGARVRGRIEAVRAIDKSKGEKLLADYRRVAW
ncbi:MAG: RNA-directed DNA [Planctomycetota bacterium]|nr:MAG: RNA-directed DNA [Planctomycetota bacterium]